jgi:tRNA threonylcarbamoyl adenosine modification protein YeaZ
MKILAIDFSSVQRSVAIVSASAGGGIGASTLAEVVVSDPPRTASRPNRTSVPALSLVEDALKQAGLEREQIECLAVGLGPGSYTGIRAAIALAQGWQLARETRLVGIGSIECLAAQAQADGMSGAVSLVLDAQRGEFYMARYQMSAKECRVVDPLRLATLAEVREREQAGDVLAGPESTRWFAAGKVLFPRAATLGALALQRTDFVAGEKLEPIYLRETTFVKSPPSRLSV